MIVLGNITSLLVVLRTIWCDSYLRRLVMSSKTAAYFFWRAMAERDCGHVPTEVPNHEIAIPTLINWLR